MPDKAKFNQLVVANPNGHFVIVDPATGKNTVEASLEQNGAIKEIMALMRETGLDSDRARHIAMGASVREPIRQLASYRQWTQFFLSPWTLDPTEDNAIPVDSPIGAAFISSPEGRPYYVTTGVQQFVRPLFYEIKAGVAIFWNTLRTAGWPILRRRMEETADDLARRRDNRTKVVLDATLAATAGHVATVAGGVMTKAALDALIKTAAQTGFPITRGSINPGRIMDMTNWTNGTTTAFPFFFSPEATRTAVYNQLYHEGYGNITWLISASHPMGSVYLSGEPEATGYHQDHGATMTASDVDIDLGLDKHMFREEHADYVGNGYNLWRLDITP